MNEKKYIEKDMCSQNIHSDRYDSASEAEVKRINNALDNVLSDDKFVASPKMSAFLSYVVQETVAGNSDRIKAYSVAVDALGKPTSFDPQTDPSVRVLANRLRASLVNYYTMNPEQALFIELYRGSYVPHFIDHLGEHVQCVANNKLRSTDALQSTATTSIRPQWQYPAQSQNRAKTWLMGC